MLPPSPCLDCTKTEDMALLRKTMPQKRLLSRVRVGRRVAEPSAFFGSTWHGLAAG